VAELTYREAVAAGIAQEMERDPGVYFIGEDVAAAGGVFKATVGLLERFGPERVRDTPISEEAIVGAAMGAAMAGLRPIAGLMFSDFLATCWDIVANQIAKTRYMTNGQVSLPLVIRTANGAGSRFGAQHSQSLENWAMSVPGLKAVAPATPADVKGLIAAAVRDPDPVIVFEHKSLYAVKGEVPDGEHLDRLGTAKVLREGEDATVVALAAMVPRAVDERRSTMVRPETVDRVRRAAAELGYRVNRMARGLKTSRSFTIGMLIPDITNPFFPPIVRGAEDGLGEEGYTLVLANTDNDQEKEHRHLVRMLERQVDGLLLAMARRRDPLVEELLPGPTPVVLVNRTIDRGGVSAVIPDDQAGMTLAVKHLYRLGHRRLAHLAGPSDTSTGARRAAGFSAAASLLGLAGPMVEEAA